MKSPCTSSPSGSSRSRLLRGLAWRLLLLIAPLTLIALNSERFLDAMLTEPVLQSAEYLKDGSVVGFRYAYVGGLMLVAAQGYWMAKTLVVRGGVRLRLSRWLWLHCLMNACGGLLLLLHAGFPLSFQYFEPFSRLNPALGYPSLVAVRGLLTWLLLAAGVSGFAVRHVEMRAKWRRSTRLLHVGLAASAYSLGILHIYLSTFLPTAR